MFDKLIAALTVNDVTAGQSTYYSKIKPLHYEGDKKEIMQDVRASFEAGGELWTVEEFHPTDGKLKGTVSTSIFGFTDDFDVWLEPNDEECWSVVARSRSRWGEGDLGKNARNLKKFYERLEARRN